MYIYSILCIYIYYGLIIYSILRVRGKSCQLSLVPKHFTKPIYSSYPGTPQKGCFCLSLLGLLRLHGAIRTCRGGRPNQLKAAMSAMEARRQLAERKALGCSCWGFSMENGVVDSFLGGGFKYFLVLPGGRFPIWLIFFQMDFKWVETTHQLHFWAKDGSNFFRFFSTMMARKVLMVMNHFANRIERGSNMEQPAFCLFWPSRRIPCPLSRRWNERSWFETRTIKPTIKPHVWKYHQISHELSNYVWNPRFWRSLFLFHRIWWFLFRFFKSYESMRITPVARLRDLAGRFLKAKAQAEVEEVGRVHFRLWQCPLVRLLFEEKHHFGPTFGDRTWANFRLFWQECLGSVFLMRFLRTKSTKPVRNVFFLCDFDRRSRDEKMNAEKRRERRSAKKSSKKKNDSSSSTRSSCSFSSIFGWRCFFSGSRIGVSFLVELSKVVVPN